MKPVAIMIQSGKKFFIRLIESPDEIEEMTSACDELKTPYRLFEQVEGMSGYFVEKEAVTYGKDTTHS